MRELCSTTIFRARQGRAPFIPADRTAEAIALLKEMQSIQEELHKIDLKLIDIEYFFQREQRHHDIRLEIEALARRE